MSLHWAQDEIGATRMLVDAYAAGGEIDDDAADALAEETDIKQAIAWALGKVLDDEGFAESIKRRIEALSARMARYEQRAQLMRAAIRQAMESAKLKKLTLEDSTLSVGKGRDSVLITDESSVPDEFWKEEIRRWVDKKALAAALAERAVSGAELKTGAPVLTIRK
jgi:hypothetical protein